MCAREMQTRRRIASCCKEGRRRTVVEDDDVDPNGHTRDSQQDLISRYFAFVCRKHLVRFSPVCTTHLWHKRTQTIPYKCFHFSRQAGRAHARCEVNNTIHTSQQHATTRLLFLFRKSTPMKRQPLRALLFEQYASVRADARRRRHNNSGTRSLSASDRRGGGRTDGQVFDGGRTQRRPRTRRVQSGNKSTECV